MEDALQNMGTLRTWIITPSRVKPNRDKGKTEKWGQQASDKARQHLENQDQKLIPTVTRQLNPETEYPQNKKMYKRQPVAINGPGTRPRKYLTVTCNNADGNSVLSENSRSRKPT